MGLYLGDKPVILHLGGVPYKLNILFAPMKYLDIPVLAARDGELDGVSSNILQSYEWRLLAPDMPDILSSQRDGIIMDEEENLLATEDD